LSVWCESIAQRPDGEPFLGFIELDEQRRRAEQQLELEKQKNARLAAKLKELGIDPDVL
jgi:hypothetical protein